MRVLSRKNLFICVRRHRGRVLIELSWHENKLFVIIASDADDARHRRCDGASAYQTLYFTNYLTFNCFNYFSIGLSCCSDGFGAIAVRPRLGVAAVRANFGERERALGEASAAAPPLCCRSQRCMHDASSEL